MPGRMRLGGVNHRNHSPSSVHLSPFRRSKGSSGIAVEVSRNNNCIECGEPLLNVGALIVFRYRGTAAAPGNLWYHKDCIFKGNTTRTVSTDNRAKCLICGKDETDFRFGQGNAHGGYHKKCIEEYIAKADFNVSNAKLDVALAKINAGTLKY